MMLSPRQLSGIRSRKFTLKFLLGHYGSGKSTVGRLICEEEVARNGRKKVIYVCFSNNSDGEELRGQFKAEFRNFSNVEVRLYSRAECCEEFGVNDSDDNLSVIKEIVSTVSEDSVIMFDEVPLSSKGSGKRRRFDWTELKNIRQDVTAIVSLQPVIQEETITSRSHQVQCPGQADVVELTQQYRSSTRIIRLINSMCREDLPIQYSSLEAGPSHEVEGPEVLVYHVTEAVSGRHGLAALRPQLTSELQKLKCSAKKLKIICDPETKATALELFGDTEYAACIRTLSQLQGCETPIAVVIFPQDDNFSRLMEMCSRAQYKLYMVIINHPKLVKHLDPQMVTFVATKETNAFGK